MEKFHKAPVINNIKRKLMADVRWKNHSSLGTVSMIDYPITTGHPSEHTDMRNTK